MIKTLLPLCLLSALAVCSAVYCIFYTLSDYSGGLLMALAVCPLIAISQVMITYREGRLARTCKSRSPLSTAEWIDIHYPQWANKSEVICAVLDACASAFGIYPATLLRPTDRLKVNYGWLTQLNSDDIPRAIVEELHETLWTESSRESKPLLDPTTLDALIKSVMVPSGACRFCGYNLRGLSEARCPECGRGFSDPSPARAS